MPIIFALSARGPGTLRWLAWREEKPRRKGSNAAMRDFYAFWLSRESVKCLPGLAAAQPISNLFMVLDSPLPQTRGNR
jgi:hypothetical protein